VGDARDAALRGPALAAAQQSEAERRRALGYEEALRRMAAGVCRGASGRSTGWRARGRAGARGGERPAAAGPAAGNFCVHCGMTHFDHCARCDARKNAFFQYCPACGAAAARAHEQRPTRPRRRARPRARLTAARRPNAPRRYSAGA
jgi:hypothetical protein